MLKKNKGCMNYLKVSLEPMDGSNLHDGRGEFEPSKFECTEKVSGYCKVVTAMCKEAVNTGKYRKST